MNLCCGDWKQFNGVFIFKKQGAAAYTIYRIGKSGERGRILIVSNKAISGRYRKSARGLIRYGVHACCPGLWRLALPALGDRKVVDDAKL